MMIVGGCEPTYIKDVLHLNDVPAACSMSCSSKTSFPKGKHFGNMAACAGQRSALRRLRRASCEICESLSPSHGHRGNRTSVSLKPSAITVWSDQLLMPFKWDLHDHWEKPFRDQMSVVPSTLSLHSNSCWKNWNSWIILTPQQKT